MKLKIILPGLLVVLYSSFLGVSCSKENSANSNGTSNNTDTTVTSNSANILISGMKFGTTTLRVKTGTTVTWTNNDQMTHTVTADDGSFTSGDLNYRDTYSYTFNTVGTYNYHCKYHSNMIASVVVSQ